MISNTLLVNKCKTAIAATAVLGDRDEETTERINRSNRSAPVVCVACAARLGCIAALTRRELTTSDCTAAPRTSFILDITFVITASGSTVSRRVRFVAHFFRYGASRQ